jgi:hypothetical protein
MFEPPLIVKPTVFVLGAGASRPYGFPVGSALAEKVCSLMPRGVGSPDDLRGLTWIQGWNLGGADEFSHPLALELPRRFRESGCVTLDEFVEAKGNHRFLPLVKAGIIQVLLSHESDSALFPPPTAPHNRPKAMIRGPGMGPWGIFEEPTHEDDDWLRYLLRIMRTDRPETFSENQVKVITFNFDRSFERRLYMMLSASYGLDDKDAATLASSVPILHMHGQLGAESWLTAEGREYDSNATPGQIHSIYQDIKIVHEEIPADRSQTCREWIDEAHTIVFLGFGYHRTNVRRLTLDEPRTRKRNVLGTAYGLTEPEAQRAWNLFGAKVRPQLKVGKTCLAMLRQEKEALQTELN